MLNIFLISSIFLPLLGFLSTCFLSTPLKNMIAPRLCTMALTTSFLCAIFLVLMLPSGSSYNFTLFTWIKIENLKVNWGLFLDSLSLIMIIVVTLISTLVHIYSFAYMKADDNKGKFFSLLSLFTFFMLILVSAPNMLQLFFGWEGVGLASYLLIGFWYNKEKPPAAAMKAFIVNRVGDLGLIAAIGFIFYTFESLDFVNILNCLPIHCAKNVHFFVDHSVIEIIAFCLLFGAMGKSAQFGLHTWLPDAMEGPTPVSALIHAATMVSAGIFLICRFSALFELAPNARLVLLIIGTLTTFFAATVAITQTDIKRIIAYSTCSQLGYMMMACGVSAYSTAMFHLVTHAFFKALLFLGAGSVIHAMSGEQDINKMGGLLKLIPFTFTVMVIGSLAITGIPIFAGFYSKDAILHALYNGKMSFSIIAYSVGMIVVFLTAFYSWRLIILVFYKNTKTDEHVRAHIHDASTSMKIPLIVLSIGALFSGIIGEYIPFSWGKSIFIDIAAPQSHSFILSYLPLMISILGIIITYSLYLLCPQIMDRMQNYVKPIYSFFYNKWYIDELYNVLFIKSSKKIGRFFWLYIDPTIDKIGPNGLSLGTMTLSKRLIKLSTGKMYHMISVFGIFLTIILGGYLLAPYVSSFFYFKG